MSRKIWIVLMIASLLATAAIPASNAESVDNSTATVEPYHGLFGADSPFYGLKLFLQNVDLSLEGNASARLMKQMAHEQERLAEAYAVAGTNNTAALNAALNAYAAELQAINSTLDSGLIDDLTYLNASDEMQEQEDILANMTNCTDLPPAVTDLYNRTLNATREFKNGRPFILCNNTTYFIPPGQMKKIASNGTFNTPPGLAKKGYVTPEPILVNNTVIWPWDDHYSFYTNLTNNSSGNATFSYASNVVGKHGNGKGNGNGNSNGNGNGKGNGNGNGKN